MTGSVERIIHSGRAPDLRKASIRRSRLIAFLRRWPEVWRISTCRCWLSSSRLICSMIFLTASAPMPASNMRPYCSVSERYSPSVRIFRTLMSLRRPRSVRAHSLASSVSRATCSRSLAVASSMPEVRSATAAWCFSAAAASASLASLSTAATSLLTTSRSFASASLLVSSARPMTSPVAANTTSAARVFPPPLIVASTSWAAFVSSSVREACWSAMRFVSESWAASTSVRLSATAASSSARFSSTTAWARATRAAASSSMPWIALSRCASSTRVTT